ncbi:N-acetylglucosamine-6-phosphate deacetylase [Kaistia dalseonensis]|uniref:N-acetylglucosamine-6-phosphate deacetylase n=1 Tax=Kaistia dalseonensis TaxID=410840 RepID=A0ABU0HBZ0_9HYPH|nr:N-acetylglucosamine-6-phosphate deacetylase [Kaistia dalseonensis]MCX5497190.1 N-acetylglucosamine-6-phosphate deacetylase [Kaistia dalseonensis]MDQ0439821.1 N-acetylglucosamine-6-phosphate deacetylase [Kaistia dalseonensis]
MSTLTAFTGAELFDGANRRRDVAVLVEDGHVKAVVEPGHLPADATLITLDGGLLVPGFVDLQVNGGGGALLNSATTVEGVRTICTAHARYGTTALLPTLITDTPEVTEAAITAVRDAIAARVPGCLGIHIEGPHLSIARKGAHNPAFIRPMSEADFDRLTSTGIDHVLTTVAAETVPPAQIAGLVAKGVHVTIGHSDASYETVTAAFAAGARGVTHLFNAMSQLGHRMPGVVGAALDSPDVWCGLIADGFHVHPAAISNALRAKRAPARIYLVTDAMSSVGSSLTEFTLNGRVITREGGKLTLSDGTLAGSDLDMISAIRFMTETIGLSLDETLRMASLYPAEYLGIDRTHGRIAPGSRADFVHLKGDLDVAGVYIAGARQTFAALQ